MRDSSDLPLTVRNYTLRAQTLNEDNRSVQAIIASEAPVMVMDMARWEPIQEVLLMAGAVLPDNRQIPLLDSHDKSTVRNQLGSTRDLSVDNGQLIGRNFFSTNTAAQEAFNLVREGHLKDNSIGYIVQAGETIPAGRRKMVKGKYYTASRDFPLRIATRWEVRENSVVSIGADQLAKVRASTEPQNKNLFLRKVRTMKFEKWLSQRRLKLEDLTEDQAEAMRKDYDAEMTRQAVKNASKNPDNQDQNRDEILEQGRQAEITRRAEIKNLAGDKIPAELVSRALDEGWTVDAAKDSFLEALKASYADRTGSPGIIFKDKETRREALEASLLMRACFEDSELEKDKDYNEETLDQADKLRTMPLYDLCRQCLIIDRQEVPTNPQEMIERAATTVTLPIILGNVANKSMLKGYTATPQTWRAWCNVGSVKDFKTNTKVRLIDMGALEAVPASGEVKASEVREEYEEFNADQYAKYFEVSRKNLINDDLDVFTDTPRILGVRGAQKIAELVYTHLLANGNMKDAVALFHANHRNLNTTTPLDSDGLKTAILNFRNQTDGKKGSAYKGEPIDVEPSRLIVPPTLENTARGLLESDLIIRALAGSTDADVIQPTKNIYRGAMELVVEPRLENAQYTGYSAADWYVTGAPSVCDTLIVAFLGGKQVPTVERFVAQYDRLGIAFRVLMDVGVKSLDWRCMQKNDAA